MPLASRPYPFPLGGDLSRKDTALLCIDMQGEFLLPGGYMDQIGLPIEAMRAVIPAVARLQAACRAAGIAVMHTREGFEPDLAGVQPNRLWRGPKGDHAIVGDAGPLGRHMVRGEAGWQIVDELAPAPGEAVFDKAGYGTFGCTDIEAQLREAGVKNLIVCGVTSDCCIRTTVQEALDRGFDCLTVADASAAVFPGVHGELMRQIDLKGGVFGAVAGTELVLAAIGGLSPTLRGQDNGSAKP